MHIVDIGIRCPGPCKQVFTVTAFGVWECPKCGKLYKVEGSKDEPHVAPLKVAGK